MTTPTIEIIVSTSEGPSGPSSFSETKFVDDLSQDQLSHLDRIDAELRQILAASDLDQARAIDLVSEALVVFGEEPL